ncbi:hypothetical protein AAJ76_1800061493 [Vairimorpha ceranae]|uniref:Uncharacterized protein n=1 Tax=Vairimorpha ceranae TaxID=40302 RepID=A0A0F9WRN7_9MICR|nr:hypothetical protein AAJ76_1800061493 [Vairimorpha ceranae]KKO75563.1 hypothetical protein AAJ76_1800061493 [Vairimorpha ceranae]
MRKRSYRFIISKNCLQTKELIKQAFDNDHVLMGTCNVKEKKFLL